MTNNVVSQDEIIRQNEVLEMARQAGILIRSNWAEQELEAFAQLVALRYEKKIADLENIICQRHWDVLREREACSGLCDRFANRMMSAEECADAIRARGNV